MSPLTIVIIVVIVVLIFMILRYLFSTPNTLQGSVQSGQTSSHIAASSLATDGSNAPATNFTYSYWFYVNDWNYRYGHKKVLFGRMGASLPGGSIDNLDKLQPCPAVILGAIENNLAITLACFGVADGEAQADGENNTVNHTCVVSNIPIQRWVNLLISVYGRTLDVYLDGKLVRTCLLPGIAAVKNNAPVIVTPMGGFDGWTSKLQYWPNSYNPQQAWNTYLQGYRGSSFGSDYQVQVSLLENGSTQSTYTI
uniref:Lectin/glucanase superfamily protein n=1 Tax=viral metagenome TaxID=1070528 RepID=A0A6C0LMV5_9ZZZZ